LPTAIKREKGMHDALVADDEFLSATAIRQRIMRGESVESFMPASAFSVFQRESRMGCAPVLAEALFPMLYYAIMTKGTENLRHISGVSEGMEFRIMQAAEQSRDMQSLLAAIKTKRYPQSRISRVLMNLLLGITKEDAHITPQYARVLGIGASGRAVLRELSKTSSIPVITKVADATLAGEEAQRMFSLDLLATDIYTFLYPNHARSKNGMDYYRSPVVIS